MNVCMYVCIVSSSSSSYLLPLLAFSGNSADNQDVRLVRGVADTIGKAVVGGVQVCAGCPFGVSEGTWHRKISKCPKVKKRSSDHHHIVPWRRRHHPHRHTPVVISSTSVCDINIMAVRMDSTTPNRKINYNKMTVRWLCLLVIFCLPEFFLRRSRRRRRRLAYVDPAQFYLSDLRVSDRLSNGPFGLLNFKCPTTQ